MSDAASDLGLFPLDLVLLPGEAIPLHLFEPRYRQLYADCVLEDVPFVVVQAGPTGTVDVGCSARFEKLLRRHEDGRLDVIVVGVAPVRVVEETEGRLYFSAEVAPLVDEESDVPAELTEGVLRRFRGLAGIADDALPAIPEGVPLSYAVAGRLELAAGPKQQLLESRDEAHRLALLSELLDDVERGVEHTRMASQRASTNGKVSTP